MGQTAGQPFPRYRKPCVSIERIEENSPALQRWEFCPPKAVSPCRDGSTSIEHPRLELCAKAALPMVLVLGADVTHRRVHYGDDSTLYAAMGYKRKSERKTGLTRKKKPKPEPGGGTIG